MINAWITENRQKNLGVHREILVPVHVINVHKHHVQWDLGLPNASDGSLQVVQILVAKSAKLVAQGPIRGKVWKANELLVLLYNKLRGGAG